MKTRLDYERIYHQSISSNTFVSEATKQGWSKDAILGVMLERNDTMVNRIVELELLVSTFKEVPNVDMTVLP